jgi:hypothetical protein
MRWIVGTMVAGVLAGGALAATWQQRVDDRYPFTPGDLIRFGEGAYPAQGSVWKVLRCDPAEKVYRECLLEQQSPERGRQGPFTMYTYAKRMTLVGHAGAGAAPAAARRAAPRGAPTVPVAAAQATGGSCPHSPYGGPVQGTRPASAALFQQKITDSITMAAYKPYWYGVRLTNFSVGAPIRNRVTVRPGVGAVRVNNGAPVDALMYPVSTTMGVCEGAPNGSSSWRTSQKKYLCFVSANNEWTCGASS